MRPVESRGDWFNIFVLHQNRVAHSPKNFIHESMLDNFLDFIIWGHEHECKITPHQSQVGDFFITQPGSTICTALSEFEALKKHCGLLEIKGSQFRLKPIPLQTVRPFVIEDVVLASEGLDPDEPDKIDEFLASKVEEMIAKASEENPSPPGQTPRKPLIRLRVEYTGFDTVSTQKFGQRFVGKVANPKDILLFHKRRSTSSTGKVSGKKRGRRIIGSSDTFKGHRFL